MKSGFVAICGRPNAGKSTLMNKIIGEKVAIVSNKPQTTRTKILGVHTQDDCQVVLIDTPGIHKPHNKLGEKMEKYISLYENAEELLTLFNAVKAVGDSQNNKMKYVADWFMAQFPNYKEMPLFNKDGKILYVAPKQPEEKKDNVSTFTKTA